MSASLKFIALSVLCLAAALAQALPLAVNQALPGLDARGSGTMRWFGLRLYQATLYTPDGREFAWQAPFALEIRYDRAFTTDELATSSRDEMARLGTPAAELPALLMQLRRIFPNVIAGDVIVGAQAADGSTRFWHNGRETGQISDPRFGRRFFGIWLSPDTREPALRRVLLEKAG
ncbi:chalcone isomerase family protein [Craterilacuibacter sp.]|uniref:chalcone isomerase family protein n=1 Tax=Craterilacuibacter sp. TaxID=2870909 RepID=UPI003F30082C